jgi:drug/metabolite transporter (DMT)-like permease
MSTAVTTPQTTAPQPAPAPAPAPRTLSPFIVGCLAATWLIWGSTYLVVRVVLEDFAPFFLMATRFLAAGGVLMAWQLASGAAPPRAREWRNAAVIGALMLGGGMGGVAYAEQTIASGLVVAFIAVMPLLLILINLTFRVFPRRSEVLAVCVGLAGVLMLTQGPGLRGSPAGLTAIAMGTLGWALGSVWSQRGLALAPGPTGYASQMLCGGVALLIMSALAGEHWHRPVHSGSWIAWAYLVLFGTLIGFNAYMVLLKRTSATLAASYSLVNPVVALVLGVTVGGERVSAWEWAAAGVVISAVVILFLGRRVAGTTRTAR